MRNETTLSKWGNSLAVRIPQALAAQAGLAEGDCVTLAVDATHGIVVRSTRRKYELSELVSKVTPKNRPGETDWGHPQGKESW
jgi:antitoxin MazE